MKISHFRFEVFWGIANDDAVMKLFAVLSALLLVSCSTVPQGLTVKQYHLRENMFEENSDPMARGEVQRLLHGSVSVEERKQKIGQYYHVIWNETKTKAQPTKIVFEYLQAGSGSRVLREEQAVSSTGVADAYFTIAGDRYAKKGRVLAWRASVQRDGKMLASKQSYMWR